MKVLLRFHKFSLRILRSILVDLKDLKELIIETDRHHTMSTLFPVIVPGTGSADDFRNFFLKRTVRFCFRFGFFGDIHDLQHQGQRGGVLVVIDNLSPLCELPHMSLDFGEGLGPNEGLIESQHLEDRGPSVGFLLVVLLQTKFQILGRAGVPEL